MKVSKGRPGVRRRRRRVSGMKDVKRLLAGFGPLATAFAIFFILNLWMFVITSVRPEVADYLSLAPNQPWGIFTSAFVHANFAHIFSNLAMFTIWGTLFLFVNLEESPKNKYRSSKIFLLMIFVAGFVVNGVEFLIWRIEGLQSASSLGASGIVYAALGVLFSFTIFSFSENYSKLLKRVRQIMKQKKADKQSIVIAPIPAFSIGIFFLVIIELVITPTTFFSAGPGIDVLAHGLGFLFGFYFATAALMKAGKK